MPITRSGTIDSRNKHEENEDIKVNDLNVFENPDGTLKQVLNDNALFNASPSSCSGSIYTNKPKFDIHRSKNKLKFLKAQLREKQLKDKIEIENKILENKFKLLEANNLVELARLDLNDDDESDENYEDIELKNEIPEEVSALPAVKIQPEIIADTFVPVHSFIPKPQPNSRTIIAGLELPKVELMSFDGNPVTFWRFSRQFDIYVADKLHDDGQRLLYLLHYCKGSAKTAIEECLMLSPETAYPRARKILNELYGKPHVVARSLINNLFTGSTNLLTTSEELSNLAIRMQNCKLALSEMKFEHYIDSLNVMERIVEMLPVDIRYKWAEVVDFNDVAGKESTFSDLISFIETRGRIAGSRFGALVTPHNTAHTGPQRFVTYKKSAFMSQGTAETIHKSQQCVYCNERHDIIECERFKLLDIPDRWNKVREMKACFICFKTNHQARDCRSGKRCGQRGCLARHNELLHSDNSTYQNVLQVKEGKCGNSNLSCSPVRLGIIPVVLEGPLGRLETYALLDSGSDTTLIKEDVINLLGIQCDPTKLSLASVNGSTTVNSLTGSLNVYSLDRQEMIEIERAYSVKSLPVEVPEGSARVEAKKWSHLEDIDFDDISNARVSLLIGCDIPEAHWPLEHRVGRRKQPFAVKTLLGWVLYGPSTRNINSTACVNLLNSNDASILEQLDKLYNSEFADTDAVQESLSSDDCKAIEIVNKGIVLREGHYEIPLPWRDFNLSLPNNYEVARKRVEHLKRRFLRDKMLFNRYSEIICLYQTKGYIVQVPPVQLNQAHQPRWYLPHHPVFNAKKPDKLRIVFDFAAKYNGVCLNDHLLQGPDLTNSLIGVLLRFRKERIAIAADVEEMFLQVRVPVKDRGALRLLWWDSSDLSRNLQEYQLTVHPFGATSSPFCANFALRIAVEEFGGNCTESVINAIKYCFYVDDCLTSLSTITEAMTFIHQICGVLRKGGFRLTKWVSNRREVLEEIPHSERAKTVVNLDSSPLPTERALGLEWNAETDNLCFKFNLPERSPTRRGILSCVSTLFDPLGLVGPILLPAKCLLQELCRKCMGWDEPVEVEDRIIWERWIKSIHEMREINIPRCIKPDCSDDVKTQQLHIFCDASERGYGAVAYVRYELSWKSAQCQLLFAKSRVSPLKIVTIPRLELNSAVLAVRVYQFVKKELNMLFDRVYFWTDSMIVLHYIANTSSRFSTFVANRLTTIHAHTIPMQWKHIPSAENPADYASRGFNDKLVGLNRWIAGPAFLSEPEDRWPEYPKREVQDTDIELKRKATTMISVNLKKGLNQLLSYYSDWFKLLKATAWLTRYKRYLLMMRGHSKCSSINIGPLKVEEIEMARLDVIRLVHKESFPEDLILLQKANNQKGALNYQLSKTSRLRKLCPILIDGVIHVGGRLQNSKYASEFKHPIILPKKHNVTDLIIRHYHEREGHSGVTHILSSIRQNYWILQAGSTVKSIIGKCVICRRYQGTVGQQRMATLPSIRIEKGWFPFEYVGIDYFGPILVKKNRHMEKRYGCVFSCLQCRAVHIEVAYSLSTDAFIMALMRFVGRRGNPREIFSDNGSNFVGADAELRKSLSEWSHVTINDKMTVRGIQWHFQPPHASHRGGVWERMIRSIRRILCTLTHSQTLTDETLVTFLVEVERILNDRPLIPSYADASEPEVLKPSTLLLLRGCEPIVPSVPQESIYSKRWRQVNHLVTVFWNRWIKEYLPTLQLRQKWLNKCPNFSPGDIVLVTSENTTRRCWPMGIIELCHMDNDGLVRTADVRMVNKIVTRDIRKLCLLEKTGEPEQ